MKKDITSREDVVLFVDEFYNKVRINDILGYIFDDVAKVNWSEHLPKLYSFWSSVLLNERSFGGNMMKTHQSVHQKKELTLTEFNEWLRLFGETIDELFAGELADEAKFRANNIAKMMEYNLREGLINRHIQNKNMISI